MITSKTISVVVLSYNNLQYIYECIESILMQNYPSIEIIISDDCSDNFNEFAIMKYIKNKNCGNIANVIINRNRENLGTVKNINIGISLSNGEYIVHTACDDVFFSNDVFSSIIDFFDNNQEFLITVGRIIHFDENMINIKGYFPYEYFEQISGEAIDCYNTLCRIGSFFPSPGLSYKRELINRYGLYDERYRILDDLPRFLYLTRNGCRVGYLNKFIVKHRLGGVSSSFKDIKNRGIYEEELNLVREREIDPYIQI